jgi:hypothetical protein
MGAGINRDAGYAPPADDRNMDISENPLATLTPTLEAKYRSLVLYDGTNGPIGEELLAAGIPREGIVSGFHPPQK